MKSFIAPLLTIGLLLTILPPVQSETEIEVSGQVRVRSEVDKKEFDADAHAKEITLLRTRVKFEATIESNTHAVVQFQDSRIFGGDNIFGNSQSGTLNDGKNVDLHQAFIRIDHLFWERLSIKAGRFEVNLGNQRVFGGDGWDNVGRSWEGAMTRIGFDSWQLYNYSLKAVEINSSIENRDFDIYGLIANLPSAGLQLFGFLEHDADFFAVDTNVLDRFSVGGHFEDEFSQVDLELNGVYQFGEFEQIDIAAFLLTGEIGYNFHGGKNVRIAGGIDYASGDDRTDLTKTKAYNNLYYTGHKFRGYMDYFIGSDTEGLIDLMLRGKLNPAHGWTIKSDLHYFKTAEDYIIGSTATSDVGIEIDLSVSTTRVSGVALQTGLSFFLPKEDFATASGFLTTNDPGIWAYSQATANF